MDCVKRFYSFKILPYYSSFCEFRVCANVRADEGTLEVVSQRLGPPDHRLKHHFVGLYACVEACMYYVVIAIASRTNSIHIINGTRKNGKNTRVTNSCGFRMAIKKGFTCGQLVPTTHILTCWSKFIYFASRIDEREKWKEKQRRKHKKY